MGFMAAMQRIAIKQGLAVATLGALAYVVFGDAIQAAFAAFLVLLAVIWMES